MPLSGGCRHPTNLWASHLAPPIPPNNTLATPAPLRLGAIALGAAGRRLAGVARTGALRHPTGHGNTMSVRVHSFLPAQQRGTATEGKHRDEQNLDSRR